MRWSIEKSGRLLPALKDRVSRSNRELRWLVEHNRCRINGVVERFCSTRVQKGDHLELFLSDEKGRLETLFEDEHLILYNKPAAFPSERLPHLLVHRLDRDTTGVMVAAKTAAAQEALSLLFYERKVEKEYRAIVSPPPAEDSGVVEIRMSLHKKREGASIWRKDSKGLYSKTSWQIVERKKQSAELKLFPKTGRTHQIRLHMKELGCPIVGDVVYGSRRQGRVFRPLLHARKLSFIHPFTQRRIEGVVEFGGEDA